MKQIDKDKFTQVVMQSAELWNEHLEAVVHAAITGVVAGIDAKFKGKAIPYDTVESMLVAAVVFGIERGFELKSDCPFVGIRKIDLGEPAAAASYDAPEPTTDATAN